MKKFAKILVASLFAAVMFVIANSAVSAAQQSVIFTRPSFDVVINGYLIDSVDNAFREYPFYVYNDITYFPMTFTDCATLGLSNNWSYYGGNVITHSSECKGYEPVQSYYAKPMTATATLATDLITIDGTYINNAYEEYPVYTCNNVLYFPMTWRWTYKFGWNNVFTGNTLYITADADYVPVNVINRYLYLAENDELLYKYDVLNSTSKAITSWQFEVTYLDRDGNIIRDRDGYVGSVISGEYLDPYDFQSGCYANFGTDLMGCGLGAFGFDGVTEVVFEDGTVWVQPILG